MHDAACALCGRAIPPGTGYVVCIDVFADPEMPPMTADEITAADVNATLAEVMQQIKGMTEQDLQDGVHRRFEYRLCQSCHRGYLANPLGMPRKAPIGKN
jgi:hypothetical protein